MNDVEVFSSNFGEITTAFIEIPLSSTDESSFFPWSECPTPAPSIDRIKALFQTVEGQDFGNCPGGLGAIDLGQILGSKTFLPDNEQIVVHFGTLASGFLENYL